MISLGYLAYIRVSASIPASLASVQALVGASVFPIGLIVILMAGGELITGNMMAVSIAFMDKKISFKDLLVNFLTITLANLWGALFMLVQLRSCGRLDPQRRLLGAIVEFGSSQDGSDLGASHLFRDWL